MNSQLVSARGCQIFKPGCRLRRQLMTATREEQKIAELSQQILRVSCFVHQLLTGGAFDLPANTTVVKTSIQSFGRWAQINRVETKLLAYAKLAMRNGFIPRKQRTKLNILQSMLARPFWNKLQNLFKSTIFSKRLTMIGERK